MGKHSIKRKQRSHCKNGHFYVEGSFTLRLRNGNTSRYCNICHVIRNKNRYLKVRINPCQNVKNIALVQTMEKNVAIAIGK